MAEFSDSLQGQTNSRTHDDGETPLGKASQSPVIRTSSWVMDSDPQEGNDPDDSGEEHGLKSQSRNSDDTQRVEAGGLVGRMEKLEKQSRVSGPELRGSKKEMPQKQQESSNAPRSMSLTEIMLLQRSKKEALEEEEEKQRLAMEEKLRRKRDGGRGSLTQEQKDHASRSRQGAIPDVGSAGSGPSNEHCQECSAYDDSDGESIFQYMLYGHNGTSPPYDSLSESDVEDSYLPYDLTAKLEEETKLKEAALAEVSRLTAKLEETKSKEAGLARIFTRLKKKPKLEDVALANVSGLTTRLEETKSKEAALAKVSGLTAKIEEETKLKEAALAKVSGLTAKLEETESKEAALTRIFTWMTRLKKKPKLKDVALANVSGLITELEETESKEAALTKVSGLTPELQEEKEAALTKGSKPNSSSDQASPVLIPRATSTMDWQTNAQRLKYEVNRDALYTLSRNIYHWILRGVRGCLVQSYYCSQSTLMKTCDRIRGRRRIFWTCECGMRTHWDLPSRTSDAEAAALVASLDRPSKILTLATESNRQETNSSPSTSLSAQSQHSTIDERHASTPPSSASENENGDVCLEIAQGQEADCTQKPLMPRFIELCINSGRNKRIVAEIDVTEMKTDAEVFVAIADKYRQSRKGRGCVALIVPQFVRRWITISKFECSFMRPGDIVFRKFVFYQHQSPEIATCNPGLPPEFEVRRGRYDYKPCPMDLDEIMPAHHFFHILDDPVPHTSDTWMLRLPKKLHDSLLSTKEQSAPISWGIHINETPNWYLVFMTIFLILLASGVFSITWAAVTKDVQGAFGMGAYIVAALTTGMTALFFKCSEER